MTIIPGVSLDYAQYCCWSTQLREPPYHINLQHATSQNHLNIQGSNAHNTLITSHSIFAVFITDKLRHPPQELHKEKNRPNFLICILSAVLYKVRRTNSQSEPMPSPFMWK